MKNAAPIQDSDSALNSADYTIPSFPKRTNTVLAEVLAKLLLGQRCTALNVVMQSSTTRMSSIVFDLREHGWRVQRNFIAVGTKDGRISHVCEYFLLESDIRLASVQGANKWIESVWVSREQRRLKAENCKEVAARMNIDSGGQFLKLPSSLCDGG